MAEFIQVNGKRFQLAESFRPAAPAPFVGREQELRLVQAAFLNNGDGPPLNVLLVGGPGVGKTALAEEASRRMEMDLYTIQGNDGMVAEELAVTARPSDEGIQKIEYLLSGLASAMARGGLCLIDEIGKLRPRTLAMLAPVADHRRTLHSALAGFSLTAHRDFRLLATSNSTDFTTAALPEFITERLSVRIHLDMPDRPALDRILRERFCRAHENTDTFLSLFWELWPQRFERLPSPRQLIQTCQFACNLAASTGRAEVTRADVQEAVDAIHP